MSRIFLSLLIATLSVVLNARAQTAPAGDDVGAAQVDGIYPAIEQLYRDLHSNPELAFQEHRTAATLAARVKALGYEVTTGVGGTGIVAILKNGPGPVVMLRTELDALPMAEKTGLPFASTVTSKNNTGEVVPVAHMCGHDIHMAAWVGTAELMAKNREHWQGTLMLVGQPAEEIVSGANAMIRDGLFTRFPKPDYALGIHDEMSLPAGVIGFHAGYFRANSTGLEMTIYGKGGHGAFPQSAIDPVVIAARIVIGLQTVVSRETNPMDPAVVTVGSIHGGSASNIIPDQVTLQITVRSLDPAVQKRLLAAIARQAKGEALAANAPKEPLIETLSNTDAVYNDPDLVQSMVVAARAELGADRVVEMPAQMGGEDFSQFGLAGVRIVLLHVGAVDAAKLDASRKSGVPLPSVHSPLWAPEHEPTIKAAIRAETAILMDLLKSP
ncbi:amidohydrolase [Ahniella affigens]|uniref:Amidohydrolase n=1 Tax=Ahniella affigens TaxID=2021234 RepID=A0A2P1PPR5_9GAMM|nr:amidohydrolase [Ahniella affigens]AVP96840.1 amidohydrolase [Ahniella affigens]